MKKHSRSMSQKLQQSAHATLTVACVLFAMSTTLPAQTQTLTVLHNFAGQPTDGRNPTGGLLFDPAGNLYGVTSNGGAANAGTAFKLDPNGTESVLHSFAGAEGDFPSAGLARDAAGNLYGVTSNGGTSTPCPFLIGCGIVFKLDPAGTETVLHRFGSNGPDGTGPMGRLILDNSLNLFGTTQMGGEKGCKIFVGKILTEVGCGTVFKVDATGNETILYRFLNATDGAFPRAGLTQDASGNLFGTASTGGVMNCTALFSKCGTVFEVDTTGTFSMLYSFQGASTGPDGGNPLSSLLLDAAGNLIGTTSVGGTGAPCSVGFACGTIFQVTPAGKEALLHSFVPGDGAAMPTAGLVQDAAGNFYGLSSGNVFKLDSTGKESVLFTFTGNDNLASGELVQDAAGNLYGMTPSGTSGFGTVFKLTTPPDFAVGGITLTPATVNAGGSASAAVDLVPVSGFNDTVTLACSVSPTPAQAPQCSISTGTPARVTVTTSGPSARVTSPSGVSFSYATWLPLLGLLGIGSRFGSKQRKIKTMLLSCVLFAGVVFQAACGGGGSSGSHGTPTGAYTITITGTSGAATGSLVRSTSTALQVQ
jgi:uncharacterized repeat protein (TIGR03803 family)